MNYWAYPYYKGLCLFLSHNLPPITKLQQFVRPPHGCVPYWSGPGLMQVMLVSTSVAWLYDGPVSQDYSLCFVFRKFVHPNVSCRGKITDQTTRFASRHAINLSHLCLSFKSRICFLILIFLMFHNNIRSLRSICLVKSFLLGPSL